MNYRKLVFAGGVTTVIGMALGIVLVALLPNRYSSGFYQKRQPIFITVGAALGLLVGTSQEAIRQLQQKQDQQ